MDSLTGLQQVLGLAALATFLLALYALIDLLRRPARAFEAAGVSRVLWLVVLVISLFLPLGVVLTLWWLLITGPKVRSQAKIGGIGFPDGRMHH